jgi:ASC-1-like (ASCH) protein
MDHVAIMKKAWKLIPKILDGQKKVESRWGVNKCAPWGKIKVGDKIFFKNSGEPVTVTSQVLKVNEFKDLNIHKIREIFTKYGGDIGISDDRLEVNITWAEKKRYSTLIYLKNPKEVKPFEIDKKGFGSGCAWITVEDINIIKKEV